MTRMTRLLALLLALVLPLQLSWAVVGEYCQHESSPVAAHHFGHHQHVHKDDTGKVAGKTAIDSDCSFCHAGAPATMAANEPQLPELEPGSGPSAGSQVDHPSAFARAPDRPQWLRLA